MLAEEALSGLGYWHWGQRRIFSPVKSRCASGGGFQALIAALQGLIPKAVVDLVQGCVQGLLFFLRGAEELSLGGRPPSAILPALKTDQAYFPAVGLQFFFQKLARNREKLGAVRCRRPERVLASVRFKAFPTGTLASAGRRSTGGGASGRHVLGQVRQSLAQEPKSRVSSSKVVSRRCSWPAVRSRRSAGRGLGQGQNVIGVGVPKEARSRR